ncbi:uncharacterized protein LOC111324250 [Stylophora pistillata]|uniref:uncharacterized protein LOC111324250 n=1 Tax=Stylophora pistillata TaxID=50429 RepID=UPI000C04AE92|nr:uncharacterized protein LOC111324250 [Stylophora pistillata]
MVALSLVSLGRFALMVLLLLQCGFLTAFPVRYKNDFRLIPVALLYAPAIIYSTYFQAQLIKTFFTWFLYVLFALIPHVAITFALCRDELDKHNFLGPNCLRVILCITPLVFLLLVNTASDLNESEEYQRLATLLSVQSTIDLFDGVEMLGIVIDNKENALGISKEFETGLIVMACLSFLLTLSQVMEKDLGNIDGSVSPREKVAIVGNVLQIFVVNLPFLIMRLVVFIKYNKDESIFIAKNGIATFLSAFQIYWIKKTESELRLWQ